MAGERIAFQGLPARICWLGYGERRRLGLRFNEMVKSGELRAPIVIGRDHLDSGSVASPYRETESMADGSDAIADWPLLNAMVNTAAGASWVSIHHGGGVGIGRSIHAGMVCVADGSDLAAEKLDRVLTSRPGHGRDPPRRRGLRAGERGRGGARRAHPDARARRVSRREIVEIGHPVLRERAREVTPEELRSRRGAEADRRHDRDDARGRTARGSPRTRSARRCAIAVVEVRPGNPRYPYKPPVPLTVIVNPVIEPLDDEVERDQRGLPVRAEPARGGAAPHERSGCATSTARGWSTRRCRRGLTAGTFQHELDHLDGMLFLDRVTDPATLTTWEQFERFHSGRLRGARARDRGAGGLVTRVLVRAGLARRRARRGRRAGRGRGRRGSPRSTAGVRAPPGGAARSTG